MNQLLPLIRASIPPVRSRTGRGARGREQTSSILNQQRCAWLALAASCAAYLLLSLPRSHAFHPWGRLTFFDLHVYRGAARLVLDGQSLYAGPIWQWAPFTYPPFAAVVLAPLALLPFTVDAVLVTVLGIVALFTILSLALRLPSSDRPKTEHGRSRRSVVVPLAVAVALWLEPITSTLGYGQINLLIALLVVWDLSRRDGARGKGALIGIAAGLKLTPLIFVPYLLLSRRPREACVALGTFAATIAAGYALLPGDSGRFWAGGLFRNPQRVGGSYVPANQSLRGLILRLDPTFGSGRIVAVALVVALAGLALAVLASRRGDEAMGFSLCALTGLLVSPVSWTHHWTLAVPALLLLGVRVVRRGSRAGLAALVATLLIGYSYLPKLMTKPAFVPSHRPSVVWTLAVSPYVLIGLLALAVAGAYEACRASAALTRHSTRRPGFVEPPIAPNLKGTDETLTTPATAVRADRDFARGVRIDAQACDGPEPRRRQPNQCDRPAPLGDRDLRRTVARRPPRVPNDPRRSERGASR